MVFDAKDALQQYKRAVWSLLIANGGVLKESESWRDSDINYYGGNVDTDRELTVSALEQIRAVGIDWNASTDPASHVGQGFNGTFTDTQLQVPYLKGFLCLEDGQTFIFLASCGDSDTYSPSSFQRMLELIVNAQSVEDALDRLEDRLTSIDSYTFGYYCRIP